MITKNDCMSILVKLEDRGLDINTYMMKLAMSKDIPIEVLKFIAKNRGIEVANFYEMLRKNHNKNKSPLYTNIIKEQAEVSEILVTLSSLLTQIALYARKLNTAERAEFVKAVRAEEISRVLNEWYKAEDATNCINLLKLIKTDLLVLEYISDRRELTK